MHHSRFRIYPRHPILVSEFGIQTSPAGVNQIMLQDFIPDNILALGRSGHPVDIRRFCSDHIRDTCIPDILGRPFPEHYRTTICICSIRIFVSCLSKL